MNKEKIQSKSYYELIKNRAKRLLIPYICFEIVGGLLQMALMGVDVVNPIGIICGIVTIRCHVGADWFLPTLFLAEVMFYTLAKKFKWEIQLIVAIGSMILAFVMPDYNYFVSVLRRIFIAYGYIICGYIGKNIFSNKSKIGMFLSGGVLVVLAYFNGIVDLSMRIFHNPVIYCIAGVLGTYMVLNISYCIKGFLKAKLVETGKESLMIMGTHQHIMILANCLVGSEYSLQIQVLLLISVFIYETLLISLKRCGCWSKFRNIRIKPFDN